MKKEDFADAMPNMSHYFKIQNSGHHGKVFLPEAFVVAEEVDSQQRAQEQRSGMHFYIFQQDSLTCITLTPRWRTE